MAGPVALAEVRNILRASCVTGPELCWHYRMTREPWNGGPGQLGRVLHSGSGHWMTVPKMLGVGKKGGLAQFVPQPNDLTV
jgi:hypothetical protein